LAAIQLPEFQNLHIKVSTAAKQVKALNERPVFTGTRVPRAQCARGGVKWNLQLFCLRS
jgi:hypothetical protein